jgi:hypothetical protein
MIPKVTMMFRVPLYSRFSFLLPAVRRRACKVTSKNEWHYLRLNGTPGNVSSANSPGSERTSLGRKSPIFWALCRWNPHVSCNLRPVDRVGNAHPACGDVSRGEPPGQEGVQPDPARWLILEHRVLSTGNRSASKAFQTCRDLAAIYVRTRARTIFPYIQYTGFCGFH